MSGGATTPQATSQATQQVYAPWFTALQKEMGGVMGGQVAGIPALQQSIHGGGAAGPNNNIAWGQPPNQQVQMIQPNPIMSQAQGAKQAGGALNNLPTPFGKVG